jgi:hypothetical protein
VAAKPVAAPVAKPAKPVKVKKIRLERDRFTFPQDEYAALVALKQRAAKLAVPAGKNTMLRAGIRLLTALSDTAFMKTLAQLPPVKPAGGKKTGKD